jgi:hypothetical protein
MAIAGRSPMTRRKGERTSAQVDRDYPYQVEIEIPEGSLGTRLNAMYAFCDERRLDYATRSIGNPSYCGHAVEGSEFSFGGSDDTRPRAAPWKLVKRHGAR